MGQMATLESAAFELWNQRSLAVPTRPPSAVLHHTFSFSSHLAAIPNIDLHEVSCHIQFMKDSRAIPTFHSFVTLAGDLILNINNSATAAIPIGTRIVLSFLSSAAVRSAGFQGIAVLSLTPATLSVFNQVCF